MADLICKIVIPDVPGLEKQELTVGRHFVIQCEGQWDKSFDFAKAQFELKDQEKYVLKLFKAEARDTKTFEIDATTYVAGQIKIQDMILSDQNLKLNLGTQQFEVKSVLPQPEQNSQQQAKPEPPKPFGYAFGSVHWPIVYTLGFFLITLIIILQVLHSALRRKKWNQLKRNIEQFNSAVEPEQQFYKAIRQLEKNNYPVDELSKSSKIYILRKYKTPVFDLSVKECDSFLKKIIPYNSAQRRLIVNMLKDIEHLQKQNEDDLVFKNKFIHKYYNFIEKCEENPLSKEADL